MTEIRKVGVGVPLSAETLTKTAFFSPEYLSLNKRTSPMHLREQKTHHKSLLCSLLWPFNCFEANPSPYRGRSSIFYLTWNRFPDAPDFDLASLVRSLSLLINTLYNLNRSAYGATKRTYDVRIFRCLKWLLLLLLKKTIHLAHLSSLVLIQVNSAFQRSQGVYSGGQNVNCISEIVSRKI